MVAKKNKRRGKGLSMNARSDENKMIRRIVLYDLLVNQRKSPTKETIDRQP